MDVDTGGHQEILKVLVVEDNASQRRTLCDLLTHEGFEPLPCGSAKAALEVAKQEKLSVAIVDLRLPDLTGTQVLDHIRAIDDSVEVIIHTAYGSFDSAKDSVNLGAFAYLEKPSHPEELLRQVHRAAQRWMKNALQRSQDRYQTLAELSPVGIFHTNANGIYQYVNERWSEIADLSEQDVIEKGWAPALHPDDRQRVLESWYEALSEEQDFALEYRLRHRSGKTSWVYAQTTPQYEGDVLVGYVGTLTDLTEHKLAQESLRVLNAALEQAQLPLAVTTAVQENLGPCFVYANPAFTGLSNYLEEDLIGQPLNILFGAATETEVSEAQQQHLAEGRAFTGNLTCHRQDGEAFTAEWRMDPVSDWDDKVTHWVAILREVPPPEAGDEDASEEPSDDTPSAVTSGGVDDGA